MFDYRHETVNIWFITLQMGHYWQQESKYNTYTFTAFPENEGQSTKAKELRILSLSPTLK